MIGTRVERLVQVFPDGAAIAKRAAQELLQNATAAVKEKGSFSIALAGGSTPKTLYTLLVTDPALRSQLPWDKIQLFFGDERSVGPDHADSNFRMANETLVSKAPLKPDQVHRIKGEDSDLERAALDYERTLRSQFHVSDQQLPRFDLILLGMGNEGHTLSLFPGTKALHDNGRLVKTNWVGKLYTHRVTITAPVACNAAQVIFMVTGSDKALALKGVLEGPYEPDQLPAQLIQPKNGKLLWLVDTAAASALSSDIRQS